MLQRNEIILTLEVLLNAVKLLSNTKRQFCFA